MQHHAITRRRSVGGATRRSISGAVLVAALTAGTAGVAVTTSSAADAPTAKLTTNVVPKTPTGLNASIEGYQPYVGQKVCDPAAKPGVVAFRDLLLKTYPASGSLGIVRDCGSGGQSEHKEGRAFDWANSASDATDVANVNALLTWLLKTDEHGNANAMVRRTGLMYVIWNKRIWKSYQASKGWQPYSGASPHTDHVHFSFGWSGAKKATSYWSGGKVAAIDYGPNGSAGVTPVPEVTVTPDPANIAVQRLYGELTLAQGQSQNADAVKTMQRKVLAAPVDGVFGSGTAAAVRAAQAGVELPATGTFTPTDWKAFFPVPTAPFGSLQGVVTVPGGIRLFGAAIDNDTPDPVQISITTGAGRAALVTADLPRPNVAAAFPASGPDHGYDHTVVLPDGTHHLCANALNAPGTPGTNTVLGCTDITVRHSPQGKLDVVTQKLGATLVSGWAVDTDTAAPLAVNVLVDNKQYGTSLTAATPRAEAGAGFPSFGNDHGFTRSLDLAEGKHTVCAYAANVGAGRSTKLGCSVVTVDRSAHGGFETLMTVPAATYPGTGPIVIGGWAYDRDTTAPVAVRVRVDGKLHHTIPASFGRPDIGARLKTYGDAHGFVFSKTLPAGVHEVCIEAVNSGARGKNADLGCRKVTVGDTLGLLERVAVGVGKVAVVGWSLDPDVAGRIDNAVYVDGERVAVVRTGLARPDLAALSNYGTNRGFGLTIPVTAGRHTVCMKAYNVAKTVGKSSSLGCKVVTVR